MGGSFRPIHLLIRGSGRTIASFHDLIRCDFISDASWQGCRQIPGNKMTIYDRRLMRPLIWLVPGLLTGMALGFFLGWVAWPVQFSDADPDIMEESYQRDYAVMIAGAYSLDEDLPEAQRLLDKLDKKDRYAWLMELTVDVILTRGEGNDTRNLVKLASDLGLSSPAMDPYLPDTDSEGGL